MDYCHFSYITKLKKKKKKKPCTSTTFIISERHVQTNINCSQINSCPSSHWLRASEIPSVESLVMSNNMAQAASPVTGKKKKLTTPVALVIFQ
jgi:hypothetical protein